MKAVASFLCMEQMVSLRQQELPVQIDEYIQKHYTEKIDAVSIAQHFDIGKTKIYEFHLRKSLYTFLFNSFCLVVFIGLSARMLKLLN